MEKEATRRIYPRVIAYFYPWQLQHPQKSSLAPSLPTPKVPSLCKRRGKKAKAIYTARDETRLPHACHATKNTSLSPATLVVLGNICDKHPDLTESSTLSRGEVRHKFGFAVLLAADISEKQWRCGPPCITICPQLRYLLCLWLFNFDGRLFSLR